MTSRPLLVLPLVIGLFTCLFVQAQPASAQQAMTCTQLTYNLHKGSTDYTTNGQVSQLQVFLGQAGYFPYQAVGVFGPITFSAVQNFQAAHGIPATGYVGPITRNAIAQISCQGGQGVIPPPSTSSVYIQTLSSTSGAPGTTINAYGSGFTPSNAVVLGGSLVSYVPSYNGATLSFTVPNLAPGTYTLYIQNSNGSSNPISFAVTNTTYNYGSPYIQSLSPTSGPAGTVVTVYGSGFTFSNTLLFNGSVLPVNSINGTTLSFTVPNLSAGTYSLYVQNSNGTSNQLSFSITSSYTYQTPVLQSLSPTSGPAGTTVTIQGSGFTASNTLVFNGTSMTVNSTNGSTITFTVPNLSAGTYSLYVQNSNGISNTGLFTITQTLTPIIIQNSGSTNTLPFNITINTDGSGTLNVNNTTKQFSAGTLNYQGLISDIQAVPSLSFPPQGCMKSASFGVTITLSFNGQTSGDLTCPPSATSYQTLKNDVNNVIAQVCPYNSCQTKSTVTPATTPTISSVIPSSAIAGTIVTIYGTGFTASNNSVLLSGSLSGSIAKNLSSSNGTTLMFTMPNSIGPNCFNQTICPDWVAILQAGTYNLSVENTNGTSNTVSFTYGGGF